MENNLLHNIKAYFTDEVLGKLANQLGEEKEQVRKGINVVIPSLLLGLQGRNQDGLSSVLQSAKHLFNNFDIHDALGKYFMKDDRGERVHFESDNLTASIFGDKLPAVQQSISKFLGLKPEVVTGLFGASMPAVISGITNKGGRWDVQEIAQNLANSRSSIVSSMPAGLGLGTFGSLFAMADTGKELKTADPSLPKPNDALKEAAAIAEERKDKPKSAGYWWIVIPVLLIIVWFLFGKSCKEDNVLAENETSSTLNSALSADGTPVLTDLELPDGSTIKAYPLGVEEKLLEFLESDYSTWTDAEIKANWYTFDNLSFESGTANITPESKQQLENIGKILALFPNVRVKIGGYTDKRGDDQNNLLLSQQRADTVMSYINTLGNSNQVAEAEGYGSAYAVAAWDASDKERAKDRRVAISIRR